MLGKRKLKVFLCHSSGDKPKVCELFHHLIVDGIAVWFDEANLLPGHDWDLEIRKAVRASDIVIICLSKGSITKAGYVQKEIRIALDLADEKPEGAIFVIPAKLEECSVPERLRKWQWVNLFEKNGYLLLKQALFAKERILELSAKRVNKGEVLLAQEPPSPIEDNEEFALYVEQKAMEKIENHVRERTDVEVGGVLVGRPFSTPDSRAIFVVVVDALCLNRRVKSVVAFEIGDEELKGFANQANMKDPYLVIVGWYLSHPYHGVYLSGSNMHVVRSSFNHNWSITLVLDPIRNELGFFVGENAIRLRKPALIGTFSDYMYSFINKGYLEFPED